MSGAVAPARVLVVRPDRIGDLMLTTPVFRALKEGLPGVTVGALVRPVTAPLLEGNPDVDTVVLERGQPLGALAVELRAGRWDASLHAFLTPRTAFAAWRAGISRRIGPASKWAAVWLSERVVQRRSLSTRHEADYNLELLGPLGIATTRRPTRLELTEAERDWGRRHVASITGRAGPVVGIHPGSGNSAGRWPLESFVRLAERLGGSGASVLLTFGPEEGALATAVQAHLGGNATVLLPGSVDLRQMAASLAALDLFVANSTGPLHMAVALGIPTVSFYSLTLATRPTRWGPYAEGHITLTPPDTPGTLRRLDLIPVDAAFEACQRQLAR